jgi:hypothetical protein
VRRGPVPSHVHNQSHLDQVAFWRNEFDKANKQVENLNAKVAELERKIMLQDSTAMVDARPQTTGSMKRSMPTGRSIAAGGKEFKKLKSVEETRPGIQSVSLQDLEREDFSVLDAVGEGMLYVLNTRMMDLIVQSPKENLSSIIFFEFIRYMLRRIKMPVVWLIICLLLQMR